MLGVSTASSHHLFQGFPTFTRPGRISPLPYLHLPCCTRSRWARRSVYTLLFLSLSTSSFLLNWMLELSLLLFFSRLFLIWFTSSSTCSMPKQSPPGALSMAKHNKRTLHKQCRTAGDAGGEKHLPLLIKMRCFALSRRVGSRPGEQICEGHGATVL